VKTVLISILLLLIELFAVALIVAPRAVLRWLKSSPRTAGLRLKYRVDSLRHRQHSAHPSREGT
jgi:hypothetical protein